MAAAPLTAATATIATAQSAAATNSFLISFLSLASFGHFFLCFFFCEPRRSDAKEVVPVRAPAAMRCRPKRSSTVRKMEYGLKAPPLVEPGVRNFESSRVPTGAPLTPTV